MPLWVIREYSVRMMLDPRDPLSEVLTISQAALEIGRPAATLRDWVRHDRLQVLRLPGSRRTWTTARMVREAERDIWLNLTTHTARPQTVARVAPVCDLAAAEINMEVG